MEDDYINNTSQDKSYNDSNESSNYDDYKKEVFIGYVVTCIIVCIGLPLTLMASYAFYSMVRNDHVAPIYIINLLISNLIQLCCMIVWVAQLKEMHETITDIYEFGLMSSVGFMVCVAVERYLLIAFPLWYRFRRSIKITVVVCVVVWALPLVYLLPVIYEVKRKVKEIIFAVFLLLPFPLFIFFLCGTLKALAASRVPSDQKHRIVGILVVVVLTYMMLFLPCIIWFLVDSVRKTETLTILSFTFHKLSPLADLALYVFMRKGTIDKLLASVCCCRMDSNDVNISLA